MTFEEIANKLENLRVERLQVRPATYANYKEVVASYQHIINDLLVLTRNIAQNLMPSDPQIEVKTDEFHD